MLIREVIQDRIARSSDHPSDRVEVDLPRFLKTARMAVRPGMLRRLASSRAFALGDRSGVLRAAQNRSGRPFRLDVRQRVIVKAFVSRHTGRGAERAAALGKHLAYLGRAGAGAEGLKAEFFDRSNDALRPMGEAREWGGDRHHFRFVLSPEHADRLADLRGYVREVMNRVASDLGEPDLKWLATCHYDTDQPHAHVVVRGMRSDGRDLVIPRDYMGYGFRARAQEVAQERLGDLSRVEAERRIWRETEADRFTGFDRRLLEARRADGTVEDGVGANDAWAALTRGRLRHLEGLGLAVREGRRYRLDDDMELRLRTLQLKRDVIRTLNQRHLEGVTDVRPLGEERVRGAVVRTGFHDEVGAAPWVVVKDHRGTEWYARLRPGAAVPKPGQTIGLKGGSRGIGEILKAASLDLDR